jgi:hypothetical protein
VELQSKVLLGIISILLALLQTGCQNVAGEAQSQAHQAVQGVIELGNSIIKIVNEQAIEPFLSDNPAKPDNIEIGFTPKYIPIRIAVDIDGNILISSSSSLVTDIGAFDIGASKKIISQEQGNLLIIQIDDQVAIYKLPAPGSNEKFKVDFSDKNSNYRLLSFEQETNGNIILKLETLKFNR